MSTTNVICAPAALEVGQQSTCTAIVTGYSATGIISWLSSDKSGIFSATPCTLSSEACGITYTPTSSATITATYSGDKNNIGSSGTFSITANVNETVQITVANSGPTTSVTLSGCSVTPTTILTNGVPQSIQANSGCSGIVITLPSPGADFRYVTAAGTNSLTISSCAASSCQAFSATIYAQVQNAYQASPKSPAVWSTAGSILVSGTTLSVASQPVCTIAVSTGSGQFSCQGWTDYNSQAIMGSLQVSPTQRWATGQSSFIDTTGGNQHSSNYFAQVLEYFQYSLVGSTTAPSSPQLSYTTFGGPSTLPLVGSASSVWMDSGSSWSVPAALQGSTPSERWDSTVTSGAATVSQNVSLSYYHQYLVDFVYSVVGNGTAYSSPSVSFTSFGAPSKASIGWVDSGSAYGYTNPLAGSTAVERWFTPTPTGAISGAGAVSAVYYHQYAFVMNFSIAGGGIFNNPRMNFTSLGSPQVLQLNGTQSTFWLDTGTRWGASPLLPSSSSTEQWITKQPMSGTANAPLDADLQYYHQFLATLHYNIFGAGGSPPVPRLNYTSYGTSQLAPLGTSPAGYWMDSGTAWQLPLTLAGTHGERWMANVTGLSLAFQPVKLDVQYAHQFFVEAGSSTQAGGSVGTANGWYDQQSSVILNETAAKLWSFAYWQGATPFSYNGTSLKPTLPVTGAANETAIFFPGLFISTDGQGSVTYSYGSILGTVPAGTNTTIYVPPGRNVTLVAVPNTVEIMFGGWSSGVSGTQITSQLSTKLQTAVSIYSPGAVRATFGTDYADIRTFAIATIGVFVAACYVFIVKRGFAPKLKKQGQF